MKTGILNIINYLSGRFFGSPDDPEDVEIKLLIEDEKAPYWYVKTDRVVGFEELQQLKDFVESEGHVLEIWLEGFWISSKESYEKRQ